MRENDGHDLLIDLLDRRVEMVDRFLQTPITNSMAARLEMVTYRSKEGGCNCVAFSTEIALQYADLHYDVRQRSDDENVCSYRGMKTRYQACGPFLASI